MAYITDYQYYENGGAAPENANWGSYQYVSLEDIVNNFLLMYNGNHSLLITRSGTRFYSMPSVLSKS